MCWHISGLSIAHLFSSVSDVKPTEPTNRIETIKYKVIFIVSFLLKKALIFSLADNVNKINNVIINSFSIVHE